MAGFKEILGHEQIIGHLRNTLLQRRCPMHTSSTDRTNPEMMLAEAFAQTLQVSGLLIRLRRRGRQSHAWNVIRAGRRLDETSRILSTSRMKAEYDFRG